MPRFLKVLLTGVPLGVLLAGAAAGLVFQSGLWLGLGVIGAFAAGAPKLLSRRDRLLEQVAAPSGALDRARLADLERTARDLRAVQGIPGAEQPGIQLAEQFDNVNAKLVAFRELLASKFDPGELTHGRYLRSAEQVQLAVLDEIQEAVTLLKGRGAVDIDRIRAQVRILERKGAPSEAQAQELETLRERLALREQDLERVRGLLATTERSLTTLTLAGSSLAAVQTTEGRSAICSASSMRELEELAERASRYAVAGSAAAPPPLIEPGSRSGRR
jgi:hypothetical protein